MGQVPHLLVHVSSDLKHFLKSLYLICYNIASVLFWFFGREACGILVPQQGIKPIPGALEGKVLTTALPGKSLVI